MTSVVEQFNENLRKLPILVNDAICAIENSLNGTRRQYALDMLNKLKGLKSFNLYYCMNVEGFLVPQLSSENFCIEFLYEDCKIKGGDLQALDEYVDQLCQKMNETYPFLKFSRDGKGSTDHFQALIPITWTF